VSLFGQELNPETWAIARMNMLLHGAAGVATVERGDTLRTPRFLDGAEIRRFELVIANPPFSPKNWGHDRLKNEGDPFDRIKHVPPKSHGEMAFVQHMIASLEDDGRMAVVLPNGAELSARKDLVDQDLIEAVIQLPKDMFYGAGIPACFLVLNRAKSEARRGKVLFIDGSACFEREDTKNVMREGDIERVSGAFRAGEGLLELSSFIALGDIEQRRYNLTVRRYVKAAAAENGALSFEDALASYEQARTERAEAEHAVNQALAGLQDGVGT
jgi:type I restriction enzyme M protein